VIAKSAESRIQQVTAMASDSEKQLQKKIEEETTRALQEQNKLKDEIVSLNKVIASRDAEKASEKAAADATIKKQAAEIQGLKESLEKEADSKAEIASSNATLEVENELICIRGI